jgi:hypothetical protein
MKHEYTRLAVFEPPYLNIQMTLFCMAINLDKFVINYSICRIKSTILNLINVCRAPGARIFSDYDKGPASVPYKS